MVSMLKKEERVRKVMIIGLDAPLVKSVKKYAEIGKMPNIQRLIESGTWAENCLVPHPTITPPNWTTIATGAWPGTHGITCFHVHKPGTDLDQTHQAFVSGDCQAEYLWEAAQKSKKKTILMNYPSTWGTNLKNGIQIGGAGIGLNEWRIDENEVPLRGLLARISISGGLLFSTEEYPEGNLIEFCPAKGWSNTLSVEKALETELPIIPRRAKHEVKEKRWFLLIQNTDDKGYDQAMIFREKSEKEPLTVLKVGVWSKTIKETFETKQGLKKGIFKCKLLELSKDGRRVKLYFSPICQTDGWARPKEVAHELKDMPGLPLPCIDVNTSYNLEWFGLDTHVELFDFQHQWMGEASYQLLKNHPWDIFFLHAHSPDHSYHSYIKQLEPTTCKDKNRISEFEKAECGLHQSLDRMVGRLLEASDEETLVIVTSDHGAIPTRGGFNVAQILTDAGLTVLKENRDTGESEIDWGKTKAVAQRSVYVYVNLKGRDPKGIVKSGEEYEKVREEVIRALHQYRDSETGINPVIFALRREDARLIGLHGEMIGDIVFGIGKGFGGNVGEMHGQQVPTEEYGMGSLHGLFIMTGPGVKKNYRMKRTIHLADIVPTICFLTNFPIPKDAEGAVIYQALKNPDKKSYELQTLRKNYARLKRAYEVEKDTTHTYF